jgi:hypothetical protein
MAAITRTWQTFFCATRFELISARPAGQHVKARASMAPDTTGHIQDIVPAKSAGAIVTGIAII